MAPRNNDANPNYKKACPTTEEDDSELDVATFIPSLLHKKHKVVKLVRSQLKKIQEEGLLNCQGFNLQDDRQLLLDREKRSAWTSQTGQLAQAGQPSQLSQLSQLSQTGQPGFSLDQSQDTNQTSEGGTSKCMNLLFYLLAIILFLLLIILLAVWISAGPLSNPMAYTPIPPGSFVRTDGLCSLEKKYLLRWSNKPDYV